MKSTLEQGDYITWINDICLVISKPYNGSDGNDTANYVGIYSLLESKIYIAVHISELQKLEHYENPVKAR